MNRGPLRTAGALAAAGLTLACASSRRPAPPAAENAGSGPSPRETAPPPAAFGSEREARAAMLMLEDERRFDGPAIEAAASRPEPRARAAAAHAAGTIGDPAGKPILRRLARDPEPAVRAAAALGLEISGSPGAAPDAVPLLSDAAPVVRCAAARAAVAESADAASEAALVEAIHRAPEPCLLYALARRGTETAAAAARALADGPNPDLRRAAVYALARKPVPASFSALERAVSDPDAEAAAWAARGLGVLGDPAGLPALATALARREPGVRTLAAAAVAQIEEKQSVPPPSGVVERLVVLARDAHPSVAIAALSALRAFPDDRDAYRTVHAQAASGTGRRRIVAFLSEAAMLKDGARPRIEEASASPDAAFRAAAASALAFLSPGVAPAVRPRFLGDADPRVREAAVGTMPFDAGGRPALEALLADPDPGVRSAVVDRLAESKDPAIVPDLDAALRASRADTIADASLSAVRAAASLATEPARAVIAAARDWPRTVVDREARRALGESLPSYATGKTLADYAAIVDGEDRDHRAVVRTARGTFTIALDAAAAPITVANFEALARKRFFDGTAWDRVVPWFVIQGGDPTGTLHGGPGYEIRDELVAAGYDAGGVGMGLEGPDTGGSQWFVTTSRQPHLDGRYPRFGTVVSGRDVVERIEQGDALVSVEVEAP